jgi:hypothetical protein
MSHSLTINLSDAVYLYLQEMAGLTQQPVEQLVQQSVEGNLPPKVTDSPLPMQPELLKMQTYPVARLRTIAESQVSQAKQERHLELLQKNSDGAITPVERVELVTLREQADQLMLRKAYAWALLRWRGYPVPALDDIAVN